MDSEDVLRSAERLGRLFTLLLDEARARPEFATRLADCLGAYSDPDLGLGGSGLSGEAEFSLVAVLQNEGEDRLRDCLRIIPSRERLIQLADDQHIPLLPEDANAAVPVLIEAIIGGVKFRIKDRMAAAR